MLFGEKVSKRRGYMELILPVRTPMVSVTIPLSELAFIINMVKEMDKRLQRESVIASVLKGYSLSIYKKKVNLVKGRTVITEYKSSRKLALSRVLVVRQEGLEVTTEQRFYKSYYPVIKRNFRALIDVFGEETVKEWLRIPVSALEYSQLLGRAERYIRYSKKFVKDWNNVIINELPEYIDISKSGSHAPAHGDCYRFSAWVPGGAPRLVMFKDDDEELMDSDWELFYNYSTKNLFGLAG